MINPQFANGLEVITFTDYSNEMVLLRFYSFVKIKQQEGAPTPPAYNLLPIPVATIVMTRASWKAQAKQVRGFMAVQDEHGKEGGLK